MHFAMPDSYILVFVCKLLFTFFLGMFSYCSSLFPGYSASGKGAVTRGRT
jgi:hypothetical protein